MSHSSVSYANSRSPSCSILMAAFSSRSCFVPHFGQVHSRKFRFFTSLLRYPQFGVEQSWLEGYCFPTMEIVLPYHSALYSSIVRNIDHEASAMDFASLWFLTIFSTCKSSKQITWFSLISLVDRVCQDFCVNSINQYMKRFHPPNWAIFRNQ